MKMTFLAILLLLILTSCVSLENLSGEAKKSVAELSIEQLDNAQLTFNKESVISELKNFMVQGKIEDIPVEYFSEREYLEPQELKIKKVTLPTQFPDESISSIGVTGTARIYDSLGFARVIATTKEGLEYLVFGTDFLFLGEGVTYFNYFCEESCLFESPKKIISIRLETYNADIFIETLFFGTGADGKVAKLVKNTQYATKLDLAQKFVSKNNLKWTVGETDVSKKPYRELKKLFLDDDLYNIQGFQYYKGGIFAITK